MSWGGGVWCSSRPHMCRLGGLKIPTMLCARTNFPKYVAGNVTAGPLKWRTPAHLPACSTLSFPNARKYSCLEVTRKTRATKQAYSTLRNTLSVHLSVGRWWSSSDRNHTELWSDSVKDNGAKPCVDTSVVPSAETTAMTSHLRCVVSFEKRSNSLSRLTSEELPIITSYLLRGKLCLFDRSY